MVSGLLSRCSCMNDTISGGPAFPVAFVQGSDPHGADASSGNEGMTMLDWFAGQEDIGGEEIGWQICEHYAGTRPTGNWKTNPVEWHQWESRWRAGVKYTRASAMLTEKRRREATGKEFLQVQDHSGDANKMVQDHSPDAGKMAALEEANLDLEEALEQCIALLRYLQHECVHKDSGGEIRYSPDGALANAIAVIAKHKASRGSGKGGSNE